MLYLNIKFDVFYQKSWDSITLWPEAQFKNIFLEKIKEKTTAG